MHNALPIQFHFADVQFSFPGRTATKQMVEELINKEGGSIEHINYIFCSDAYLLTLNQNYLKHNTLTDIITFHYHQAGMPVHSDIYISWERVQENAAAFNTTKRKELHRVIFHGALHLCGYKDKTANEERIMREREDYYLNLFL